MERIIPVYLVDAFAAQPFAGNPAAVCYLMDHRDDAWLQRVAMEMNQPETAFFMRKGNGFQLRWFTPTVEVDLCGHATLAAAHVIWETELAHREEVLHFYTRSGTLEARSLEDDRIELNFPAEIAEPCPDPGIAAALGVPVLHTAANRMDWLAVLEHADAVRALRPDMAAIAALGKRGLIVTAASDVPAYDCISRFFAPASGIPEDPVTGSAHCALGPYWGERLGKRSLRAWQASPRGGELEVLWQDSRCLLRGRAFTVVQGLIR